MAGGIHDEGRLDSTLDDAGYYFATGSRLRNHRICPR